MQAEVKINRRGDKNVLMVIERAGSIAATSNTVNSEQGEHTSTLLISVFFTATSQVRFIWNNRDLPNVAQRQRKDSQLLRQLC